jgi:DNA-binding winged helix-turn-helix (wHTH) protein/TolB-like protein/Tfp pilus assembly protein PilF
MASRVRYLYEFGTYRLDVVERLLLREGKPVEVTAKVFDLLVMMVENQGKLMEKSQLLETLWPDSFVEEVNLSVNMSALRRALGESASEPQFIETVPKRGYRFIGAVKSQIVPEGEPVAGSETPPASTSLPNRNAFAQTTVDELPTSATLAKGRRLAGRPGVLIAAAMIVVIVPVAAYLLLQRSRPDKTAPSGIRTIAVLPFKTLAADDADQALGLGMADALITRLGSLPQLIVRPTSTVIKYSDAGKDPLEAGRELGVEAILDGRVQRDDKKIRVTARLLSVRDGSSLWVGKFDDFFTNLFALQDSISEKMAEALSLRLTSDEQQLLTRRHTENTEAYQRYLEGRYFYFKYEFEKSAGLYESAIERDSDYAAAYAGVAASYLGLATTTAKRQEMRDKAIAAANKALALDPNLDEAHNAMGWVRFLGNWDWAGSEVSLRRAIELNPNNADARINYSSLLITLGRFDEGLRESERAYQLDPVSGDVLLNYAYNLLLARRYDQAVERAARMTELDPHHPSLVRMLIHIYAGSSLFERAIAEADKLSSLDKEKQNPYLAAAYVAMGRRATAEALLQHLLSKAGSAGGNYSVAVAYAALGDKKHALDWLEKAYEARDNQMIHIKVDSTLDGLRDESRYVALLRRMGL